MPKYEISHALDAWLRSSHRGVSSNTIVEYITGFPALGNWEPSHPHDAPDLGRCLRLLRAVPELRGRLLEMRTCSPVWAALVDRWDELTRLYLEEVDNPPKGKCKTYELMRDIIDPIEASEMREGQERRRQLGDTVHLRFKGDGLPTSVPGVRLKKTEDG